MSKMNRWVLSGSSVFGCDKYPAAAAMLTSLHSLLLLIFKQVTEMNTDRVGSCRMLHAHHTIPQNGPTDAGETSVLHLRSQAVSAQTLRSCEELRAKGHLQLCTSLFRRSKRLRANSGHLTSLSATKLGHCGR